MFVRQKGTPQSLPTQDQVYPVPHLLFRLERLKRQLAESTKTHTSRSSSLSLMQRIPQTLHTRHHWSYAAVFVAVLDALLQYGEVSNTSSLEEPRRSRFSYVMLRLVEFGHAQETRAASNRGVKWKAKGSPTSCCVLVGQGRSNTVQPAKYEIFANVSPTVPKSSATTSTAPPLL